MGSSPCGGKELDMTGQLSAHTHTSWLHPNPQNLCMCPLYGEGDFVRIFKNTYLAALSLSWGMRDLPSSLWCAQSFSWSM